MATVIEAPNSLDIVKKNKKLSIFLAGSIEQGKAVDWQTKLAKSLDNNDVYLLNPRRKDWDDSWKESIDNAQFKEQVEWELDAQELELGLFVKSDKMVVVCPEGFWKKGNVDIVCKRYGAVQVDNLDSVISKISKLL